MRVSWTQNQIIGQGPLPVNPRARKAGPVFPGAGLLGLFYTRFARANTLPIQNAHTGTAIVKGTKPASDSGCICPPTSQQEWLSF